MAAEVDVNELGTIPIFEALPKEDVAMLLDHATRVELAPEETLFVEGQPADALFVIISGQIALHITSHSGRQLHLATLGAGNVLGEIGLLVGGARTATAEAMEPTVVLRLPDSQLEKLLQGNSIPAYRFILNLARVLATRLRAADKQIAELCVEVSPPLVPEDDLDRLRKIFFSDWGGGLRTP